MSATWANGDISPVARALMKAHEGDIVEVRAPAGGERIEVARGRCERHAQA
jgi:transcription elongation GreA/GreB family factor